MKLRGATIIFESEAEARQALADLRFCAAVRENEAKAKQEFAAMSEEEKKRMNEEMVADLDVWNRGLCPICNPPVSDAGDRKGLEVKPTGGTT